MLLSRDGVPGAAKFTGDISKWDVSNVNNMWGMFHFVSSFNGDISKWDVVRATNMHHLLDGASSFAGTLCGAWVASSTADRDAMLDGSSGRLCTTSTTSSKTTRASPKRKNPRHVFDAVQCLTLAITPHSSSLSLNLHNVLIVTLAFWVQPTTTTEEEDDSDWDWDDFGATSTTATSSTTSSTSTATASSKRKYT